jgi:putative two-component system response regulator
VLAVADVYEALTAERPYRPAWSSDRALEIIRLDVPQRLDHDVFAALKDGVAAAAELPLGVQPR